MSKAKDLIAEYLNSKAKAGAPAWARKTEFTQRKDGSVKRIVVRNDGTVEHSSVHSAQEWQWLGARAQMGLSQAEFASLIGVSVRTIQEWEQGRKTPSGAAQALLKVAAQRPDVVKQVLQAA